MPREDILFYGVVAIWLMSMIISIIVIGSWAIATFGPHPQGSPERMVDQPCNRMPGLKGTVI